MKLIPAFLFSLSLAAGTLSAQQPPEEIQPPLVESTEAADPPLIEPTTPQPGSFPTIDGSPPSTGEESPFEDLAPPPDTLPPDDDIAAPAGSPFGPLEEQKREMEQSADGYTIIKDATLNDIFQFLAKSAGRQYFHNVKINGPEYLVTGHLNDGNPLQQMEELAFMYGLSLHTKGNTIYALTQAQLGQLPSTEFHYQLKYLRPTDMEQIMVLIKPLLSPGTGIVNFEPKTNTIIIIDTAHCIEQAREFLHSIDKTKGQLIVETKILRVNSRAAERVGVDWSSSLGELGVPLNVTRDLSSIFGLPSNDVSQITNADGANLVLSPAQASGVLRLLADGGITNQVSNPTLITEDNEQATISIIDRIPIITTTVSDSGLGGRTISDEVRYKIDTSDESITSNPENHREIGISMVVTPTLLPDGTIRMRMRPRSAQIAEWIVSANPDAPNRYPRVTESMIEAIARIPDGHSLVVGGFYGEVQNRDRNKVPLLGDIPIINFFFKSKETAKEQSSLVFVVTPKSYNPASSLANNNASSQLRRKTALDRDHDWVDPHNPGPAHEPNLPRTLRGLQPEQAPYYPRTENTTPSSPTPAKSKPRFSQGRRH